MSTNIDMPQDRYVAALVRQRKRIVGGLKLQGEDSTTPGDKYTECTWGLCSRERAAWPDAQDHLWPDEFMKRGRVAPKYLQQHQKCPLDRRPTNDTDMNGCFYTCRFFSAKKKDQRLTREFVITLYDARIAEHAPPPQP